MGKVSYLLLGAICLAVAYTLPVDQQPDQKNQNKPEFHLPLPTSTLKPVHHYRDTPLRKRDADRSDESGESPNEEDSGSDEKKHDHYQHRPVRDLSGPVSTSKPPTRVHIGQNQPQDPSPLSPLPPSRIQLSENPDHVPQEPHRGTRDLAPQQISSSTPSSSSEPTRLFLSHGSEQDLPSKQQSSGSQSGLNVPLGAGHVENRQRRDIDDQKASSSTELPSSSSQSDLNVPLVGGQEENPQQRNTDDQKASTSTDQVSSSSQSNLNVPLVTGEGESRKRRDIDNQQAPTSTEQVSSSSQSNLNVPRVTEQHQNPQQKDINDQKTSSSIQQPSSNSQSYHNIPPVARGEHSHQRRDLNDQQLKTSTEQSNTRIVLSQSPPVLSVEEQKHSNGQGSSSPTSSGSLSRSNIPQTNAEIKNRERRDLDGQQPTTSTEQPGKRIEPSLLSQPTTEKEDNSHIQKVSS